MHSAGVNKAAMANYFPVAQTGSTQSWLMNLPHDSISLWEELCDQFLTNFKSSYKNPIMEADFHTMRQKPDETLRSVIQRFS
jgi:hypothetical protein